MESSLAGPWPLWCPRGVAALWGRDSGHLIPCPCARSAGTGASQPEAAQPRALPSPHPPSPRPQLQMMGPQWTVSRWSQEPELWDLKQVTQELSVIRCPHCG